MTEISVPDEQSQQWVEQGRGRPGALTPRRLKTTHSYYWFFFSLIPLLGDKVQQEEETADSSITQSHRGSRRGPQVGRPYR
jgi:hypothetical protein